MPQIILILVIILGLFFAFSGSDDTVSKISETSKASNMLDNR